MARDAGEACCRTGENHSQDAVLRPCVGSWGVVLKEWGVIKQVTVSTFPPAIPYLQTYPQSAQNLNRLTKTVDVDIYDDKSEKIVVDVMPQQSPIKVISLKLLNSYYLLQVSTKRQERKDDAGLLEMPERTTVNIQERLTLIKVQLFDV